jgi:shikimate kinase
MEEPKNIILIGMKSSGKTTTGKMLAHKLDRRFVDMDTEIERLHYDREKERLPFRNIFQTYGSLYFRCLETAALALLASRLHEESSILATGGGLPLAEENRLILKRMGTIVFLDVRQDVLLGRIVARGIPPFFRYPDDPQKSLAELVDARRPIYMNLADLTLECRAESPSTITDRILRQLEMPQHED